jgi:hypothetical protein
MLSRDGEVKLVDFGIAVTLGAGADDGSQSAPTGSFPYMSPEQVRREPLTGQTDLFSVGVLCWEMLAGRRLFARNDPDATLAAVTAGDIPAPSSLRPEVPARLDEVVMRALERDRGARWADAAEMLAALQKYLYALDDTPGPRDVAALVARYCPPETRRLPTHADADTEHTVTHSPRDAAHTTPSPDDTPPPSGPRTAVIPRDAAPRGRAHTRQQTFATHVGFDDLFERAGADATAATTTDAQADADAPAAASGSSTTSRRLPRARASSDLTTPEGGTKVARGDADGAEAGSTQRARGDYTRGPSNALLVLAGLGLIGLTIAAIWVFAQGRDAVLAQSDAQSDAIDHAHPPVLDDASASAPDDAVPSTLDDAGTPKLDDAGTRMATDAGVRAATDGGVRMTADAGAHAGTDAGVKAPRDAGALPAPVDAKPARPVGMATLKIGADPWGEVSIDGVPKGRAPLRLQVSAGKHVVEVVFAGEDPPRKKSFPIDVAADGTETVFADFRAP